MTIGRKLTFCFGALLALTVGMACSSFVSVGNMDSEWDNVIHKVAKRADLAAAMRASAGDMRAGQRGLVLFSLAKTPEKVRQSDDLFRTEARRLEGLVAEYRPLINTETGQQSIATIDSSLRAWQQIYDELAQRCASQQLDEGLYAILDKGFAQGQRMMDATQKLQELQRGMMASASEETASLCSRLRGLVIAGLVVSLIFGAVGLLVVRRTTQALQHATGELSQSAEQVSSAASQISSSSQALAQGASEQAASLEETSASSEQISAMTRKNADDSQTAAELMNQAGQVVSEANHTLEQMQASMQEINASSEKIGRIIKVIDEIAFQTNILALNAAVEAARAGEAGMGFAVVADEVRNLAQRSAQAAKDTAGMIEESIATSNQGRSKLEEVSKAIYAITEKATKVKGLVDNVKASSGEQARGVDEIAKAIMQVEKVTQTQAASAEETASAAEELNSQAAALRRVTGRLEELVGAARNRS